MNDTDKYQLGLAQNGDKAAFGSLASHQAPGLNSFLLKLLKGRREEAEDLSQETLLRAYRSISTFRGESKLRTWLRRIASNLAINHLRKKRLPADSLEPTDPERVPKHEIPDLRFSPELQIVEQDSQQLVQNALAQLTENLRIVFVLKELEGYSHDQIAGILGVTTQAVRVRLHRAKKALGELIPPSS